jgi:two-component system, cell cycle response regulator DivK
MPGAPILVVDDAATNLKVIRMALTHEGYEVRTAERAEEALEMLSSYRPELILADIELPGMDGLDMARRVKENPQTSDIRVVAFTADNRSDTRQRAFGAGCEEYICKPIDASTLAAKVRDLLARPRGTRTSPKAEAARGAMFGFAGPEIETLQHRFLTYGAERSRQLLDSLNGPSDAPAAAEQLHQWARSAAILDYAEIAALAERGEEQLRQELWHAPDLRELFTELYIAFAERLEGKLIALPEALLTATTGKHVALIGFAPEQAEAICNVLGYLKARPLLFGAEDPADANTIGNCDLAVVHVRPETLASGWLRPETPNPSQVKLVLLGARADLIDLPESARMRAVDFVVDGQHPEEVGMRLAFALTRILEPAPVMPAPQAPAAPRRSVASPTVVMADDDEIVRALTSSLLKNHGMTCRSAENGLDALRLIRSEKPMAALLDVNMPGMSGFEVLAAIRAENLPCRVMLLTAREREDDILRGFRLGADDYLVKPFNPFELVARIKRFMQPENAIVSVENPKTEIVTCRK